MPESALTRKEPKCSFRLLNILFSDTFAEGFSQLGNEADHSNVYSGKAANNQLFWEGVQEAFQSEDPTIDNMHFGDNEVLLDLHYIYFKKIVPHDWKKLRLMWKQINGDYKATLNHFRMLRETHSLNFFDLCESHTETYYLQ